MTAIADDAKRAMIRYFIRKEQLRMQADACEPDVDTVVRRLHVAVADGFAGMGKVVTKGEIDAELWRPLLRAIK